MLVKGNGTGAEASDVHEVGRRDTEAVGHHQQPGDRRRSLPGLDFSKVSLPTSSRSRPFERDPGEMPGFPHVLPEQAKESVWVHPRELATFAKLALAHSHVGVFVDEQRPRRCTWSRMGGLCS